MKASSSSPTFLKEFSMWNCVPLTKNIIFFNRYLSGGVESGFRKVEKDKYEPRLLHIKGRRNIRVQQTRLAWNSMNSGDVFILDMGLIMYIWNGRHAGRLEKIKGLEVANRIRDEERGGRAKLQIMGISFVTTSGKKN